MIAAFRNGQRHPFYKSLTALLVMQLVFPVALIQPVMAELITDPRADVQFRPVINNSQGVPVVNIVRPDNSGVSHNKYQDFDVDEHGLVFNNSLVNGNSFLAGKLLANPALGGRSASVILNEVTGASDSDLKGLMEVFGDRANIVVANPNGITCDGCGFINTDRASMITGRSFYNNDQLNFEIRDGSVRIEGEGLSYRYKPKALDLLGRYVGIHGEVDVPEALNIVAGTYDLNYQTLVSDAGPDGAITVKAPTESPTKALAIDASVFGAMQAGKINIMGTEQGLGVKADGYLFSHADDLFISSAGGLTVSDADAFKKMTLTAAEDLTITDDLIANESIQLKSKNISSSQSSNIVTQHLNIDATNLAEIHGELKAMTVIVQADDLKSDADILAVNRLDLNATSSIEYKNAQLVSEYGDVRTGNAQFDNAQLNFTGLSLIADQAAFNQVTAQINSADFSFGNLKSTDFSLNADRVELNATAWIDSHSQFNINSYKVQADSASLENSGWVFGYGDLEFSELSLTDSRMYSLENTISSGSLSLAGSQLLSDQLIITSDSILSQSSQLQGQFLNLTAGSADFNNTVLAANHLGVAADLTLSADSLALATDDIAISGSELKLHGVIKTDRLTVHADQAGFSGIWQVADSISADVSGTSNITDFTVGSHTLSLQTGESKWNNVSLQATSADITVDSVLDVRNSAAEASDITITASHLITDADTWIGSDNSQVVVTNLTNNGTLLSAEKLQINAEGSINNQGKLASFSDLEVSVSDITNSGLVTSQDLSLSGSTIDNTGDISAEALDITYQEFTNQSGASLVADRAAYRAADDSAFFANYGEQVAASAVQWLKSGSTDNSGSYINAGKLQGNALNFSGLDAVDNRLSGVILSNGTVQIGNEQFIQKGRIDTDTLNIIRNQQDFSNQGDIFADTFNVDSSAGLVNNGKIVAETAVIDLGHDGFNSSYNRFISHEGSVLSARDLSISGADIDNSGQWVATNINVTGSSSGAEKPDLVNHATGVIVQRHGESETGSVFDFGSAVFSGFGQFLNKGSIESDELIHIRSVNIFDNHEENLAAHQAAGTLNQAAIISSAGGIVIENTGSVSNSGLMIASSLFAEGNQFENSGVIGAGEARIQLTGNPLVNNGKVYQSGLVLTDAQRSRIFDDSSVIPGITTAGLFEIYAGSLINGDDAAIEITNGNITLTADRLENRGLIRELNDGNTETALHLNGIGLLDNYGDISLTRELVLKDAGTLRNYGSDSYLQAGSITSAPAAVLEDIRNDGTLLVRDQIDLTARNITNNSGARIFANDISLTSQDLIANAGLMQSEAGLSLKANRLHNGGELIGKGTTSVAVNHLDNEHLIYGNTLNVGSASQRINEVSSQSDIRAQALAENQPTGLVAAETLNLYVSGIMADVYQASNIFIDGADLSVSGTVIGDNKIDINTNTLAVEQYGKINIGNGGDQSRWNIVGALQNDGDIDFASDLNITSDSFLNNANVRGEANLDINTGRFENRSAGIISTKNSASGSGSRIRISGLADGFSVADKASDWVNNGQIHSDGGLDIAAGNITVNGNVKALGDSQWHFNQLVNNDRITIGGIWSLGNISNRSGRIVNNDRMYGGSIDAYTSGNIDNIAGAKIVAYRSKLNLDSLGDINNLSNSVLYAKENFDLSAGNRLLNTGTIEAFSGDSDPNGKPYESSISAAIIDNGFAGSGKGKINVAGSLTLNAGQVNNNAVKSSGSSEDVDVENIIAYRSDNTTGGSYYYWRHYVMIESFSYSDDFDSSEINVGKNLKVTDSIVNNNASIISVNESFSAVRSLVENNNKMVDVVTNEIAWYGRTVSNSGGRNDLAEKLDIAYAAGGEDWEESKAYLDSQISYNTVDSKYYWKDLWGKINNITAAGTTADDRLRRGDAESGINYRGSRQEANPKDLAILYVRKQFSGIDSSIVNKGNFDADAIILKSSDDASQAAISQTQKADNAENGENTDAVMKGSFINGTSDSITAIANNEPTPTVSLLSFVIPGLSFDALNAASVAGDKTPEELAAQAALQAQLNELNNDRNKNGQDLQSQSAGHSTQAPSLFDLDEDILSQIIADTEYELQPDYIFDRLGESQMPDAEPVFFLDPYQEAQAITQAALAQTGTAYFSPDWSSSAQQRQSLYDNTLTYLEKNQALGDTRLGQALTRDQIAQLEAPMIWYVAMDIGGQQQLVPTVYLPQATLDQITTPSAGTIIADNMDIDVGEFKNTGNIKVTNSARIQADVITNQRNVMRFGDESNYTTIAGSGGNIEAGDLSLISRGDINNNGGSISSREDLSVFAGGDINFNALQLDRRSQRGKNIDEHTEFLTSQIRSGGNASFRAGGDFNSEAAKFDIGGDALVDAENINLLGVTERDYQQRYSEKKGTFSSSKTTTQQETLTFQGTELGAGGNLLLNARNDMTLVGADVSAGGNATLNAENNILITAGINQDSYSKEKSGSGVATTSAQQKGHVKQEAVGSTINSGGNLQINSNGGDVEILASSVAAENNITLGDTNLLRDENGAPVLDDNGQFISADGSSIGNLTVGTVELKDEEWNVKQSGLKGPLKNLASAAMFVAGSMGVTSQLEALGVDTTLTVGHSEEQRVETTHNATSSVDAGGNLIVRVDDHLQVDGSQLNAAGNGYIETGSTTVTAVMDTTTTTESRSEQTVASTKPAVGKQEVTVAGVTATDHTETTTTTQETAVTAGLNVGGNLIMNSEGDINLLGSDLSAGGDASLTAQNINVEGVTENSSTTHTEKTEVSTTSLGVKNAYVDAVYAADAVAQAGADVEAAKNALADAERRIKDGSLAASALGDYKANLAAATTQLAQATLNFAAAGATAAGSTGTGGFYASASAQTTTTEKESTSTSQNYVGSNINVGGNASFNATDALNIIGSSVNVQDQLALNGNSVTITAGTEESTSSSSEQTYSAGMSFSNSGGNDSFSANASANSSESDSYSKTHVNSSINAGSLTSTSDQLTIAGANIEIQNDIDITTGQLTIASLQDESRSSSHSEGYNVSGSMGGSLPIDPSNVGGNQNDSSSDSKWVNNQTTLIGGAAGNGGGNGRVNINADTTEITGATVASATRNEDGTLADNGNLTLITDELTVTNLYDHNTSESSGVNISAGISSSGTTTVGLTNNGHNTEQTTYATLGGGTVQKKDGTAHDIADVNNDLSNTQEITLDQQTGGLDATVTVDHRLLSEDGRKDIKNNFVDTYEHGEDIAKTVDTISQDENLGILNFGEALDNNAKGTQLKNDLLRNPENQHIIDGINSGDPELYAQAMKDLGHLAQEKFGLELSDINLYDGNKTDSLSLADTALVNVKGGTVVDESNQEYGNIFIDAGDGASKTDMTNTLGHEVLETQNLQGKDSGLTNGLFGSNSADTQEALANAFGNQFADRINQAAGGDLDSSGGANFSSNLQNSQAVAAGTQRADNVGTAAVEHRQLYREEAQAILAAAPAYAAKQGISEEQAKQDLTRQALRIADQKWAAQIEENPDALAAVLEVAAITPPIKDPYVSGGLVGAFIVTPPDYENPNINANAARMLELGVLIPGEAGFMSRYATEDGRMPVELTPAQQVSESLSGLADGALNLAVSLYNDYPGTMSGLAGALGEAVSGCLSSGLGCIAVDPREGYASDRAFVALLQGDRDGAIGQNNTVLLGETVPFVPVGMRLTTGLLDKADDIVWPPNRGFDGGSAPATLIPGTKIDRYGSPNGTFVSPDGTPFPERALPASSANKPLNTYEVVKPIQVDAGNAAPWFNQPGGGIQFELPKTVQELLDSGHLK